ncbi:group III truncated hemoglobin [Flavicella sp.]|uniref:group III truncated hemoglobin n=1 Tax=Flavicella sp. TaxID=2957742 RepID=UPI003015AD30
MDIENREDLYKIVQLFYQKLFDDDEVKHFFVEFLEPENLEKHLNILVDFWDNVLFHSGTYAKNAMQPHIEKHKKTPFKKKSFEKWLLLFSSSVDELFKGENSEVLKNRAQSIAIVMQLKILH